MSPRIPSARVTRSGPDQALLTTPMSQWQCDRAGRVQPATLPVSRWEEYRLYALVPVAAFACVVAWCWS